MIVPPKAMRNNPRFSPAWEDGKRVFLPDANGPIYAPASAKDGAIARIDSTRSENLLIEDRCSGCGEQFDGAPYVFVSGASDEPPLHALCAKYALLACPHLAVSKGFHAITVSTQYVSSAGSVVPKGAVTYIERSRFLEISDRIHEMSSASAVGFIGAQEKKDAGF